MAFAGDRALVQFCVFAIGFGGGVLNGATNALAADVSEGERGAKLSLLGVFFGIGALTMPSAIASLSHVFPIEQIVAGIGALALVPAAYCLAIQFPPPKLRSASASPSLKSLRLLGDPLLLVACLAMAVQSGMEGMSNDWMTRYFKNVTLAAHADSERSAQLGLVALTGAMVVTRLRCWLDCCSAVGSRTVLLASLAMTLLRRDHVGDDAEHTVRCWSLLPVDWRRSGGRVSRCAGLRRRPLPAAIGHGVQHDLCRRAGRQHGDQQNVRLHRPRIRRRSSIRR